MRQVTRNICAAFIARRSKTVGNSHTDGSALFLHGNKIAEYRTAEDGTIRLFISNAGWQSNTTKERLNGLPRVSIFQKAGQWYLNGQPWNGEWIIV